MKFLVLLMIASLAMSMSMLKEDHTNSHNKKNMRFVVEFNVGGVDFIAAETVSKEFNKIKIQYTTFSGDVPAFDVVLDATKGEVTQFFNLTGECKKFQHPVFNLTTYLHDLMLNHTEFVGKRGENLYVYEIKQPEEAGSRTWIYGTHGQNPHHDHTSFVPKRFQSHHPGQKETMDFSGEWIDTIDHPVLGEIDFSYPACDNANIEKLDANISFGILGVNPHALLEMIR